MSMSEEGSTNDGGVVSKVSFTSDMMVHMEIAVDKKGNSGFYSYYSYECTMHVQSNIYCSQFDVLVVIETSIPRICLQPLHISCFPFIFQENLSKIHR